MQIRIWAALIVTSIATCAQAGSLSYVGELDATNPNDVFLASFTLAGAGAVTIQTWGFGGTADAPGGTNAQGRVIAAGGFDPYVSLFAGSGPAATFVASNDDGLCPPGHAAPVCADSTLTSGLLAPGAYTLALTLPSNFSFAENHGSGTLGDGFIGLDSTYSDDSCASTCTSAYAVDIRSVALVPEPSVGALLGGGLALWAGLARRRRSLR